MESDAKLTVPDAAAVRDFRQEVTGWTPAPVAMEDYQDYCMVAAGICHARGANADLPRTPESAGGSGRIAVIQDPAGAFAALWEPQFGRV
jgi:predicted enzyme related to lactoylglutathione lyase